MRTPRLAGLTPAVIAASLVGALATLSVSHALAGPTPEQKCQATKNMTAGKYAACRQSAEAKLAISNNVTKYTDALGKCATKFASAWQKAIDRATKKGVTCLDAPFTAGEFQPGIDAHAQAVAAVLAGTRFQDNGDGTVTDHLTGLQWERKTGSVGMPAHCLDVEACPDMHHVNNVYTWTVNVTVPTGTAFTNFLGRLNGAYDGTCFAGHCDWRLPTLEDLQTILVEPHPCGTSPCIDAIFGPTAAFYYWSSTTYSLSPDIAWEVHFGGGLVYAYYKDRDYYVRAVRGGS